MGRKRKFGILADEKSVFLILDDKVLVSEGVGVLDCTINTQYNPYPSDEFHSTLEKTAFSNKSENLLVNLQCTFSDASELKGDVRKVLDKILK